MNNKVIVLRAIDSLQKLSVAYRLICTSYAQDVMDTDQVVIGETAENLILLAETSIKELHTILEDESIVCCLSKSKEGLNYVKCDCSKDEI